MCCFFQTKATEASLPNVDELALNQNTLLDPSSPAALPSSEGENTTHISDHFKLLANPVQFSGGADSVYDSLFIQ